MPLPCALLLGIDIADTIWFGRMAVLASFTAGLISPV